MRGSVSGCRPRHSSERQRVLAAGHRGIVLAPGCPATDPDTTATPDRCPRRPARHRLSGRTARPPPAACTARGGDVGGRRRSPLSASGAAQCGGGDRHRRALRRQQLDARAGQRAVADQGGAAGRRDAQDLVDDVGGAVGGDRAQPGVADPLQRVEVGLRVRRRRHAHALRQRPEPIEPADRRVLARARMRRCARPGVGGVVDDVAARHRVDGDQQVGVDGQAHRAAHLAAGVDRRAGREVDRRQQRVEPAARRQRGREVVVDQPHRCGAAGRACRQPWPVRQRPQHGQPNGFGGVGRHHRRQRCRPRSRPRARAAHRAPEAGSGRRRGGRGRRSRGCR